MSSHSSRALPKDQREQSADADDRSKQRTVKDTALNQVQQAKQSSKHQFGAISTSSSTDGTLLSTKWKRDFSEMKEAFPTIPKELLGKFPKEYEKMLKEFRRFLTKQCKRASGQGQKAVAVAKNGRKQTHRPIKHSDTTSTTTGTPLEGITDYVKTAAKCKAVEATERQGTLASLYKQAIANGYTLYESDGTYDLAPIVDFSTLPKEQLEFLSVLLSTGDSERQISEYVPKEQWDYVSTNHGSSTSSSTLCASCRKMPSQHSCVHCKMNFCKSCRLHNLALYGYGTREKVEICSQCLESFYHIHSQKWINKALSLIEVGSLKALKAAFVCIQISLSLSESVNLRAVVSKLHMHTLPELALPIALAVEQESTKRIDKVKANRIVSSTLETLANKNKHRQEVRRPLLHAAKEACSSAKTASLHVSASSADTHNIDSAVEALNRTIQSEEHNSIREKRQAMEKLWSKRDVRGLISFVKVSDDCSQTEFKQMLKALEQFLQAKEQSISYIHPDDLRILTFFQGVLSLYKQCHAKGVSDIEKVIWCGPAQSDTGRRSDTTLKLEALHIFKVLSLLTASPIFTLEGWLDTADKQLGQSKTHCLSRESQHVLVEEEELTPPFKRNWSECSETSGSEKLGQKREEEYAKRLQTGEWGYRDVGFAYVDYIPQCKYLEECAMSFLHTSMWFLKDLRTNPKADPSEKYALKTLIFRCLSMATFIAQKSFHPGMLLHIGRLSLAIAIETLQIAKETALPDDTNLLNHILHIVAYNSRLVPFWKSPPVSVSEACLLNARSGDVHSQYLNELSHRNPKDRPMTEAELKYQFYENDLRGVHSVENPQKTQITAMEELLSEKGWQMSDVADLMSSPLSPRDDEGWLIQKPELGGNLEYAEIKGMVLHLDPNNPSIELDVVHADPSKGHPGTFSVKDFQQVVSMVLDKKDVGGLFFSLEQPDGQKRFHPFQEFLYDSEDLHKTELLHTLFETDYLLKSFSIGQEVSNKPPFKQRLNEEGLTRKLPRNLKEKLRPVRERGETVKFDSQAHRFWIQANKIDFTNTTSGPDLEIRLGEMNMVVKSHPMIPDEHGKLKDAEQGDDPNSPEAKFAADMTAFYDDIGEHFPIFLRLKQLAKLQVLGTFLKRILEGDSTVVSLYRDQYTVLFNLLQLVRLPCVPTPNNPCKWVPAALRQVHEKDEHYLSYGGVLIAPKISEGHVPRFPYNCGRLTIDTLFALHLAAPLGLRPFQQKSSTADETTSTASTDAEVGEYSSDDTSSSGSQPRSINTSVRATSATGGVPSTSSGSQPRSTNTSAPATSATGGVPSTSSGSQPRSTTAKSATGGLGQVSSTHSLASQRRSYTTATDVTKQSWGFNTKRTDMRPEELAVTVFRSSSNSGHDDGTGDGNDEPEGSRALLYGALVFCFSWVLNLFDIFGEEEMKAETALQELNTSFCNPRCRRDQCITCSLTRVPPVTSFTIGNGTILFTASFSVHLENVIYALKCKLTDKVYIGMTIRKGIKRLTEHLSDIGKGKDKTVARYFNELGCYGQFEDFMEISVIGSIGEAIMGEFSRKQRKGIMEFVEGNVIQMFSEEQLINANKPSPDEEKLRKLLGMETYDTSRLFQLQGDTAHIGGTASFRLGQSPDSLE